MKPDDLLVVAADLLAAPGPGAPLGARLRRSISSSYYAVFHAALEVVASQTVAVTGDATTRDAVRRAITHSQIKNAAREVIGVASRKGSQVAPRNASYKALSARLHAAGWTSYMQDVVDLQEMREESDYDLIARPKKSHAQLALSKARRTTAFLAGRTTGPDGNAFLVLVTARGRGGEG